MWSLELFRTIDGLRLGGLPKVSFSWARTVRDGKMDAPPQGPGDQSLQSFKFSMAALESAGWIDRGELGWQNRLIGNFMPTRHGIMALWDGVPVVGGVIGDDVSWDASGVSLSVDGITKVLASRFVVPEDFRADIQVSWAGYSLGTIAKRIVQYVMKKPSGALPITFMDDEPAERSRNYQAFNIANLSAAALIENISNVSNGPDIDFRPYAVDEQHFAWRMVTGSEHDPWLGQDVVHDWEQGSPDVMSMSGSLSAAFIAHRVFGVGDGQDVGTTVARVDAEIPPEWPLIEKVFSDSTLSTVDGLSEAAAGELNQWPLLQLKMTVRADGSTPLGSFWPGELAAVTVHDVPVLEGGTYLLRLLGMSGSGGKVDLIFDAMAVELW